MRCIRFHVLYSSSVFVTLLQTNSVHYGLTDSESENEMVAIKKEFLVNEAGQFLCFQSN